MPIVFLKSKDLAVFLLHVCSKEKKVVRIGLNEQLCPASSVPLPPPDQKTEEVCPSFLEKKSFSGRECKLLV